MGYIVCSQKVLVFNTSKKVTAAAFKMRYSHESLTKRRYAFFILFSFRNSSIQNGFKFILMDIYYLVFCVFMYFRNIFMIFSFIQKLKQLHKLQCSFRKDFNPSLHPLLFLTIYPSFFCIKTN